MYENEDYVEDLIDAWQKTQDMIEEEKIKSWSDVKKMIDDTKQKELKFDKQSFLEAVNIHSLNMLYDNNGYERSKSRDSLLSLVKRLADAYEQALITCNYYIANSRRNKSQRSEDAADSPKSITIPDYFYNWCRRNEKRYRNIIFRPIIDENRWLKKAGY